MAKIMRRSIRASRYGNERNVITMSASDKKKVRKEQASELLTEKQRQQQAEDKKLRIYTIGFVCAMLAVVCLFLGIVGVRAFNQSGIVQKNTIAATVNGVELNTVEMNYYFADAVNTAYNNWYTQYSTYTDTYLSAALGLDPTKPLNEQYEDEEAGVTWAQYFLEGALENAKNDYALCALAEKEGFALPEEERKHLETTRTNLETYATIYGFSNADKYLQASYGYGSTLDSYMEYSERTALAKAYYAATEDALVYEDSEIREYEKDISHKYDAYTYTSSYMSYTEFLQGGTEDENGEVTYTDAERDTAREAVKNAAEKMAAATSVEELKKLAEEVEANEDSKVTVTEYKDQLYTSVNATLGEWLADDERKEGDIAAIPNVSKSTDEDGNTTEVTNGYYVAIFHSRSDNNTAMANVRHLLVQFDGGTEDEETGETVYSDEEIAKAKELADGYLKTWKEGEATEESFIELVKEHSDDTTASTGGLFEDIHVGSNYVENFLNWSLDPDRKAGDAEVIETEYGYHVMYYVSTDELTYRDYMITTEMRAADLEAWHEGALESVTATLGDTSKMTVDLVISPSY